MTNNDKVEQATTRTSLWARKAEENIENWGVQDAGQVTLAIAEENAEVAQEVLERADADEELETLLENVAADGLEVRDDIESLFEDENGQPVDERPKATVEPEDVQELQEEVDDLGALVIQLQVALNSLERK